ncbi:MFS transporter [Bradyrhizobium sp. 2TAF24]|uniref:MFS transporter n=1 Tax=Bradyrhizobium sp. 2TAF24 TaxID=3233011 RepID=UPI003F8E550C
MDNLARAHRVSADDDGIAAPTAGAASREARLAVAPSVGAAAPALHSLSHAEVRTIVISLMVAMFLTALDQTIVATALPTIGRQFLDVTNLSWVITAYLLSSTSVAPVFGSLSDIYGRRAMMMTALGLFLVGSVLCALAPNLLILVLARFLQGLGGGGILPLVQTVLADIITPRQRAQYQAFFSMVWVSAGIGGPVLGGVIAEHLHWSVIFWINVPLVLLAAGILLPKMRKLPIHHRPRKLDLVGGLLLMAAAITFLLVLTWGGNKYAWLSPTLLALMGAVLSLSGVFVWHARRADEPFLPLPLLTGPIVPYAITAAACAIGVLVGLTVHMPMYYESVYHLTASEAGLALIPIVALSVPGATAAGRVMMYMKHYKWVSLLGLSVGAVMAALLAIITPLPLWALLTLLAVLALGLGTTFPVAVVSVQAAVARHLVGTVTGAMNFFRSLMAAVTVALFTAILLAALGGASSGMLEHPDLGATSRPEMIAAFRYVFIAAAVMLGTGALAIALMFERPLGDAPKPSVDMAE